jgi:hypothetical protein
MKTRAKKPDLCDTVAAAISDIVTVTYIIRPGDPLPPELLPSTRTKCGVMRMGSERDLTRRKKK